MALPILDGNQSATTLSSILTSGEHIPAHTVVSLGTQAITDMRGAVSGSVVSISNFPATQPVSIASVTIGNSVTIGSALDALNDYALNYNEAWPIKYANTHGGDPLPISGTVSLGNGLGEGWLTNELQKVYAYEDRVNVGIHPLYNTIQGTVTIGSLPSLVAGTNRIGVVTIGAGTVTIGAGTAQIGSVTASISNSVTIGSLPAISGTVTANLDSNSPVIASQIETGIASYAADLANNPLPISGTVTANTFALQGTAVTTSDFTSTTASTLLAGFNATREVLTIVNEGAGNLHVCAGATCTTIAYQVRLSAGDYYEVPNHQTTITHSAVFATAGTARVTEVS